MIISCILVVVCISHLDIVVAHDISSVFKILATVTECYRTRGKIGQEMVICIRILAKFGRTFVFPAHSPLMSHTPTGRVPHSQRSEGM